MLNKLENDEKKYIIAGDLNCDLIKNIINDYQIKQFIKETTKVGNSSI